VQLLVHGYRDLRLVVGRQREAVDRAHRRAADLNLVALDQLTAGLEEQLVVVAARAAEHENRDQDDRRGDGADGQHAGQRGAPVRGRTGRLS
jgi:hypothetical protein